MSRANLYVRFPDGTVRSGAYYVKEYRIYERVYKRNVWHVATRSNA